MNDNEFSEEDDFDIYEQGEQAEMMAQENHEWGYQTATEDFFGEMKRAGVPREDAEKMIPMFFQHVEIARKAFEFYYNN